MPRPQLDWRFPPRLEKPFRENRAAVLLQREQNQSQLRAGLEDVRSLVTKEAIESQDTADAGVVGGLGEDTVL